VEKRRSKKEIRKWRKSKNKEDEEKQIIDTCDTGIS
jgi:hypothetical protein